MNENYDLQIKLEEIKEKVKKKTIKVKFFKNIMKLHTFMLNYETPLIGINGEFIGITDFNAFTYKKFQELKQKDADYDIFNSYSKLLHYFPAIWINLNMLPLEDLYDYLDGGRWGDEADWESMIISPYLTEKLEEKNFKFAIFDFSAHVYFPSPIIIIFDLDKKDELNELLKNLPLEIKHLIYDAIDEEISNM